MTRPYLLTAVACCLSVQASAHANSPFDGAWVADLDTQSGLASDMYLVKDGNYGCATCEPPRSYRADGKPHPVPGDPDVASESVSITGPRTIVTHIVRPPLDRTTTMTVAADDQTATYVSLGGVDKFEPVSGGGEVDHAEEAAGELVVAGGDGAVDLEVAEHALDAVALLVERSVMLDPHPAV